MKFYDVDETEEFQADVYHSFWPHFLIHFFESHLGWYVPDRNTVTFGARAIPTVESDTNGDAKKFIVSFIKRII